MPHVLLAGCTAPPAHPRVVLPRRLWNRCLLLTDTASRVALRSRIMQGPAQPSLAQPADAGAGSVPQLFCSASALSSCKRTPAVIGLPAVTHLAGYDPWAEVASWGRFDTPDANAELAWRVARSPSQPGPSSRKLPGGHGAQEATTFHEAQRVAAPPAPHPPAPLRAQPRHALGQFAQPPTRAEPQTLALPGVSTGHFEPATDEIATLPASFQAASSRSLGYRVSRRTWTAQYTFTRGPLRPGDYEPPVSLVGSRRGQASKRERASRSVLGCTAFMACLRRDFDRISRGLPPPSNPHAAVATNWLLLQCPEALAAFATPTSSPAADGAVSTSAGLLGHQACDPRVLRRSQKQAGGVDDACWLRWTGPTPDQLEAFGAMLHPPRKPCMDNFLALLEAMHSSGWTSAAGGASQALAKQDQPSEVCPSPNLAAQQQGRLGFGRTPPSPAGQAGPGMRPGGLFAAKGQLGPSCSSAGPFDPTRLGTQQPGLPTAEQPSSFIPVKGSEHRFSAPSMPLGVVPGPAVSLPLRTHAHVGGGSVLNLPRPIAESNVAQARQTHTRQTSPPFQLMDASPRWAPVGDPGDAVGTAEAPQTKRGAGYPALWLQALQRDFARLQAGAQPAHDSADPWLVAQDPLVAAAFVSVDPTGGVFWTGPTPHVLDAAAAQLGIPLTHETWQYVLNHAG